MVKARKALDVKRPSRQRQSAASEAKKLTLDSPQRLSIELPAETHRALKIRAAESGMSIKAYVVALLQREGIPVPE